MGRKAKMSCQDLKTWLSDGVGWAIPVVPTALVELTINLLELAK